MTNEIRVIDYEIVNPKKMITKEKFCFYINYINFLVNVIDDNKNHVHIKSIIKHLHKFYHIDRKGFSEIEHYCFFLNFGKCGNEYESVEEFYNRLNNINI